VLIIGGGIANFTNVAATFKVSIVLLGIFVYSTSSRLPLYNCCLVIWLLMARLQRLQDVCWLLQTASICCYLYWK